jgi:hypothetical protein
MPVEKGLNRVRVKRKLLFCGVTIGEWTLCVNKKSAANAYKKMPAGRKIFSTGFQKDTEVKVETAGEFIGNTYTLLTLLFPFILRPIIFVVIPCFLFRESHIEGNSKQTETIVGLHSA